VVGVGCGTHAGVAGAEFKVLATEHRINIEMSSTSELRSRWWSTRKYGGTCDGGALARTHLSIQDG